MTNATATDALRALVGRMIPASAEFDVPGADDPAIFADILANLTSGLAAAFLDTVEDLSRASASEIDAVLARRLRERPDAASGVIAAVMQAYYRDDRVMRSLGMEPRAPFPKGFELEAGDWSLLEPVRSRPAFWRPAS